MQNIDPNPKPEVQEEPKPEISTSAHEDQTGDAGSFSGETISELDLSEG